MIITYIHSNHPADSFRVQLRCRNFVNAINRRGWHRANLLDLDSFIQNTPEARQICGESDLLVIHRYLYGPVLQSIEYWKARDKKIIVDFDQAVNHLSSDIPCSSFWLNGKSFETGAHGEKLQGTAVVSTPVEQFKWGLGLVHAAIVSSTRLVIDWLPFTEVYEVPDYLNRDQYPAFKQAHENEIWIGMTNHARSTSLRNSGLLKALENVCRSRPQVRLILPDSESEAVSKVNLPPSQVVTYPSNSFGEWADILLKLDIGLVPIHGEYDLRLGRIHLLEFMISKTPWIASDQPCCRELSRYGKLVQNVCSAWEAVLLKMVDNLDIIQKRAAGEPFLFALSQDVNENIDKVLKLYTHILSQTQRSGAG
jgi:glycosyltransferase involved in cell wall biosynthesis